MQIDPMTRHVQLDTRDPAFYQNPYPTYHTLREQAPVFFWKDYDLWAFTRQEDVNQILRDRRFGRQITHILPREAVGLPPERPEHKPFTDVDRFSLLELEPPDHTRLRGLIQKAFMARQINRLRPRIAQLANQLIDTMEADAHSDLLTAFATPIPVTVIAELLGVPTEMSDHLLNWSHAMVRMYELGRTEQDEHNAVQAAREFNEYLRGYVALRRRQPQDDLISHLLQAETEGQRLTEDELISTCILLLNAGHEATVNVIGNGVYALLKNHEQLEQWRTNSELTASAIEELLRYDTPLHLFQRWVLEDVTIADQTLTPGTKVALLLGSANRDPAQFDDPDQLDLNRTRNPHLSFGGGIHYCLGAPLARLELQTAIPILLNRLPTLHLVEEPHYRNTYHFRALERLLVGW